jgi:hypothetical protein
MVHYNITHYGTLTLLIMVHYDITHYGILKHYSWYTITLLIMVHYNITVVVYHN